MVTISPPIIADFGGEGGLKCSELCYRKGTALSAKYFFLKLGTKLVEKLVGKIRNQ